jgi:hypothetical protein
MGLPPVVTEVIFKDDLVLATFLGIKREMYVSLFTRSLKRGRHLPETVHKFNGGYIQDAELERMWHQHKWRVQLSLAICR